MVSNIAVTITGNRAAASAYLLVLISKDGNHRSLPPGRCACELIKEGSGQWRFSRRTIFHDHGYTLDGIGRSKGGRCWCATERLEPPISPDSLLERVGFEPMVPPLFFYGGS